MAQIILEIDPDQLEAWIRDELRRCYVDNATIFHKEKDSQQLGDALLTVIEHYSAPSEYDKWYEEIKDL